MIVGTTMTVMACFRIATNIGIGVRAGIGARAVIGTCVALVAATGGLARAAHEAQALLPTRCVNLLDKVVEFVTVTVVGERFWQF